MTSEGDTERVCVREREGERVCVMTSEGDRERESMCYD